jgi:23S rRNA pseudouridine1911/1915/1917 synthase
LPDYSRSQIQVWLEKGEVFLNDHIPKARTRVLGGEKITINATLKSQPLWEAQSIPLNIIFEDEHLLVINKPSGMVVHPAMGNYQNTLLNALLHHAPDLQKLPRAGIIHRLDKDTSGLLVIAKTAPALTYLTKALKARAFIRIYQTIINGLVVSGGTINEPIGRHPTHRIKMAIIEAGKTAVTHYRIIERYRAHTRLKIQLETGRTHQIRVHMAHIRHSVVGDPVYGGRLQLPKGATPELIHALRNFKRQALHAMELTLTHPVSHQSMTFEAPLPNDMIKLIEVLKQDAK